MVEQCLLFVICFGDIQDGWQDIYMVGEVLTLLLVMSFLLNVDQNGSSSSSGVTVDAAVAFGADAGTVGMRSTFSAD